MHILSLVTDKKGGEWQSGREENGRRNYFMINLHEGTGPGCDRTHGPGSAITHVSVLRHAVSFSPDKAPIIFH